MERIPAILVVANSSEVRGLIRRLAITNWPIVASASSFPQLRDLLTENIPFNIAYVSNTIVRPDDGRQASDLIREYDNQQGRNRTYIISSSVGLSDKKTLW